MRIVTLLVFTLCMTGCVSDNKPSMGKIENIEKVWIKSHTSCTILYRSGDFLRPAEFFGKTVVIKTDVPEGEKPWMTYREPSGDMYRFVEIHVRGPEDIHGVGR